jgi:hypothetical protein
MVTKKRRGRNPMLSKDQIKATLSFLARVDLKGSEAPALMNIVATLNEMLTPPPAVEAPKEE